MSTRFGFVLAIALSVTAPAFPQNIYWVEFFYNAPGIQDDHGVIRRADPDGGSTQDVLQLGSNGPYSMAVDSSHGQIYWIGAGSSVYRANLDGSGARFVFQPSNPLELAIDSLHDRLYWRSSTGLGDLIQRSNLDGSNVETIVGGGDILMYGLTVDALGRRIYFVWTTFGYQGVFRCDLDGANLEPIVEVAPPYDAGSTAVDPVHGKLYWALTGPDPWKIQRANLDGSQIEDVATMTPQLTPGPIAVDPRLGYLYWTELDKIRRSTLDGGDVTDIVSAGTYVRQIAVATTPTPIPTLSTWGLVAMFLGLAWAAGLLARRERMVTNP